MPRTRLLAALVVFVVVAAACGGEGSEQADPEDARNAVSSQAEEAVRAAREAIDVAAREERADDFIRAYHIRTSAFYAQITELNAGAEGSKGVAYTRARESYEAGASPQDSTLLSEFEAIRRAQDLDEVARLQALPLSPAVKAAIDFAAVRTVSRAVQLPSFDPVGSARTAVKSASRATDYQDQVIAAADAEAETSVYGHLLNVDLATAARAYVEASADYPTTIRLAFEAATTAFNNATEEPHSAAYDAARAVFEEAVTALKPAEDAYSQAYAAAWDAASEETKANVRDLRRETDEARKAASASAWAGLEDARNAVSSQAEEAVRAAREAIDVAAREALVKDSREAAVEAARASRAEGLAAAVVAEVVNQFDSGRIEVHPMGLAPATFVYFVVSAVVVESLIRSDARAALQQSLTKACQ